MVYLKRFQIFNQQLSKKEVIEMYVARFETRDSRAVTIYWTIQLL